MSVCLLACLFVCLFAVGRIQTRYERLVLAHHMLETHRCGGSAPLFPIAYCRLVSTLTKAVSRSWSVQRGVADMPMRHLVPAQGKIFLVSHRNLPHKNPDFDVHCCICVAKECVKHACSIAELLRRH